MYLNTVIIIVIVFILYFLHYCDFDVDEYIIILYVRRNLKFIL